MRRTVERKRRGSTTGHSPDGRRKGSTMTSLTIKRRKKRPRKKSASALFKKKELDFSPSKGTISGEKGESGLNTK